ncbi:MAG: 2-C-methyl-D-erythritol 2,4-cyclodiphosphate synthase [Lentisphaeria bacterium]
MIRIGQGCDFHRFDAEGCPLVMGGIQIPHPYGLKGNSDADVLLHAITDAVLGALAAGDIGKWFPPDDDQYKDADSAKLLETVLQSSVVSDWRLGNLDATVICEKPRLRPHIDKMRTSIAEIFGVRPNLISIKATTTEEMGFTGRGEGIAAWASVLLQRGS